MPEDDNSKNLPGITSTAMKLVPFVKYAVAVVGIAALVPLIMSFDKSFKVTLWTTIILISLAVVIFVLSNLTDKKKKADKTVRAPAILLLWGIALIFLATVLLLFTSVFFKFPTNLANFINPEKEKPNDPKKVEDEQINISGIVFVDGKEREKIKVRFLDFEEERLTNSYGKFDMETKKKAPGEKIRIKFSSQEFGLDKDTTVPIKEYEYYSFTSIPKNPPVVTIPGRIRPADIPSQLRKKSFLPGLINSIEIGANLYNDYTNNRRSCRFIKPIYLNNKKMFELVNSGSYIKTEYNKDINDKIDQLKKHLSQWITAYENQESKFNLNSTCAVEYEGTPFPGDILVSLKRIQ
jgi:hypothetical protein